MKKLIILLLGCLAGMPAFAQSVGSPVYEPFSDSTGAGGTSYTPGSNLAGQSPTLAAGFTSGTGNYAVPSWWLYTNSVPTSVQPTIVSGDLSYAGLASTGGGRSAQFGGSGNSALMNLTTASGNGFTSGTVYYSFTLKLTDLGTLSSGSSFFAGFTKVVSYKNATATPISVGSQLWVESDGGTGYHLGIALGSNGSGTGLPVAYDTAMSYSADETLFIVGSYALNSGAGNDEANLWIDPDSSTFGAASAPGSDANVINNGTATDLARVASFTLFDNSANEPTGQIDDLRVGLDWADVTPAPEPSTLAFGALALAGFCLVRFRRK